MAEQLTFLGMAKKVLEEQGRALSASQIWDLAESVRYTSQLKPRKPGEQPKTPKNTLNAALANDVRRDASEFERFETEPVTYYLKNVNSKKEVLLKDALKSQEEVSEKSLTVKFLERDLHPFLAYYFRSQNIVCKTIRHQKSTKKTESMNEWLHPDVVGVSIPFSTLEAEIIAFAKNTGINLAKLYSVELKQSLNFGNLRETFFQAVSNSTWANEGYLAAAVIDDSDAFRAELGSLSSSFGVGVIKIDLEDPDATAILFPAKYREEVDWVRLNKIANINPDLRSFMARAKDALGSKQDKETLDVWFDPCGDRDEVLKEFEKRSDKRAT